MKHWIALFFVPILCFCNPSTSKKHHPVLYVKTLTVGVYEYNAHTLDIDALFDCLPSNKYCTSIKIDTPIQTKNVFQTMGWNFDVLASFLQTEDYQVYDQKQPYHVMVFLFQSNGVDYMRVVNQFSKNVKTIAMQPGQVLDIPTLLANQGLMFIESEPTLADVYIGEQKIEEAPVWIYLPPGKHTVSCKLAGRETAKVSFEVPGPFAQSCRFTI